MAAAAAEWPRPESGHFELFVAKAACKFNAAHFIAHPDGYRERMHGHNYRAEITVKGRQGWALGEDGYLLDFGSVKKALKASCAELDETFLCPAKCAATVVTQLGAEGEVVPLAPGRWDGRGTLRIVVKHDGAEFTMPRSDAIVLPLEQASAELLAWYICCHTLERLGGPAALWAQGAESLRVGVVETEHQEASFTLPLRPGGAVATAGS
ncbi:hypothetical protein FNF31_05489 [Cafeteria roenbergensis]|uniref:6-pyruvoyltetrahydropterin synthase n=1 Tax=Cafeteria roenbergensis TaxID=33653 RepID=A0A5A8CZA1_CAFRO|nr:hypothetical protein FNF31_05489 [Cafeteria roenbergensis]